MASGEALKRLGGGRWETKDGRFSIEPESGTWVVVDNEQTNELGLPLVRGPFPSLTAAREAVDGFRAGGPAASPLAKQLEASRERAKKEPPKPKPEAPPEPKWLTRLDEADQRRARSLIKRLEKAGREDAEDLARAEVADDQPALAEAALVARLAEAATRKDARAAVRAAVDAILGGEDDELGATWRLADGDGRRITRLDLP